MHHRILSTLVLLACAFALVVCPMGVVREANARENPVPKELQHVGIDEHLDGQLPLDATFRDHDGNPTRLGALFGRRPVLFIFAYHSCPVLCSMVQNAASTALKDVAWTVGKEFDVVVLSIDPKDTPDRAAAKRTSLIANYGRAGSEAGFHFLVGDKTQIDRAAEAAGFRYEYDERQQQYGHPAVIMLVKPNGQLARYLYGLEYEPRDIRIGLLEASNGRSISTIERVILYCYHYDPQDGKYVLMATRIMRLGGGVTAIGLLGMLAYLWSRERRKSSPSNSTSHTPHAAATDAP